MDRLNVNEALEIGQELRSPDSRFTLVMQGDGNLVLYRNSDGKPLWATGITGGTRAVMQGDGNLVLYTSFGVAVWASNTAGNDGSIVQLQNDGNLVIYRGTTAIWASGTDKSVGDRLNVNEALEIGQELRSPDSRFTLVMQGNGNLVLYRNSDGKPLWATRTTGGTRAVMQGDGNLVLYPSFGVAVWASNTAGNDGSIVQLQNDGNLVIYRGTTAIWASGTVEIVTIDSRKRPWAVILCRFKGSPPDPALEGPIEQFYRRAFTQGSGGLVEYWRDASLGSIDISGSQVFGWVEVEIPRSEAGGTPESTPPCRAGVGW